MPRAFVSIGSNIDREYHIRAAVNGIRNRFGDLAMSHVYESAAVGFQGDDFFNMVVSFDTDEAVWDVVSGLRAIETANLRDRAMPRFSPRTLDLDLLLFGDLIFDEGGIKLPRDEIFQYAFVLGPLAEIAGDIRCPREGRRFIDIWGEFDQASQPLYVVDMDFL